MTRAALNFDLLVKFLGTTVLLCVVGGLVLTFAGKAVPDSIIGLGATALGGLITAFVRPPEGVQSVSIDGQDEPVEVTTKKGKKKKVDNG